MDIKVSYSGKYPALCFGEWIITIDGKEIRLPGDKFGEMDTYGEYDKWHFEEDWEVVWGKYYDGMRFKKWKESDICEKLVKFLDIKFTDEQLEQLYDKINLEDWRSESCGGCI